jgi:ribosome-associated protein
MELIYSGKHSKGFEKKGQDVLKIDLRKLENRITDFFIISHGSSTNQVDSLCDSVEDTVRKETGEKPIHVEGLDNCFWVLFDYGNDSTYFSDEHRHFTALNRFGLMPQLKR